MSKPRVFVTRQIPAVGVRKLQEHFDVDLWDQTRPPSREILLQRSRGAVGLLTLLSDRVDAELLDAAGDQCKVISNYAVGYNNIDVAEVVRRGARVGNTPDVLTDATADMAMCLLLAAARHLKPAIDSVRDGSWFTWEPLGFLGTELTGKTVGIIGAGRIGQAVADRCHGGWKMNVLYSSRSDKPEFEQACHAKRVDLNTLLSESDIVSLHCDLNPQTKHMMNASALGRMRPGSILINTSRGGVVDQQALVVALTEGPLAAAGLDVTDPEPLDPNHPLVALPNCVIVPHIGSATHTARDAMARIAAENLIAGIHGDKMPAEVFA
jgi:lactate dehydrogenase-like 2-hydroxyacid dehydrogenase